MVKKEMQKDYFLRLSLGIFFAGRCSVPNILKRVFFLNYWQGNKPLSIPLSYI